MKRKFSLILSIFMLACLVFACSSALDKKISAIELPYRFNSPASFTLDSDNNILFTSPNLHNETLVERGFMEKAELPAIGMIDKNDRLSTWYSFDPQDREPKTKTIVPMGIALGPDGNIYIADMQLWAGGESRILRIKVEQGEPVRLDVVAKGFSFPNALAWRDKDLFITDTMLAFEKDQFTLSGLYKIPSNALNSTTPLQIQPYLSAKKHDPHLFETFRSNGRLGFGANGLAVDSQGHLYTGIMEEGSVYKTLLDKKGNKVLTTLFSEGLIANDGIQWHAKTKALYITDLFDNAVYRINLNGSKTLLARNGDTNGVFGLLDAPSEVIVRGNKAYVANFDAVFDSPNMVNRKPDSPVTISILTVD